MVTDKMQDILGGMFTRTELSEVLTEIVKMDPNFCKEQFLKDCERDIIPNVLEAMIRGDLEILKDWLVHTLKLLTNVGKKYLNF
jgi:import inner membrane translocase subunit TIM44